ncbi:MAG: tRNA guanosine(34) transglycosylase Tgt [Gemmataceae bacterium]
MHFTLLATDGSTRLGRLETAHGVVDTPAFMPVGTRATVKGLTPQHLKDLDAQIILGNTYHLALRPGDEIVAEQGGLHRFMGWDRPILTDSGGFQVFSLGHIRRIDDHAAVFKSHIDGRLLELTPERAIAIQENLGSDIAMCLDECPPGKADPTTMREAVRRTILWAKRCRDAHTRADQMLFGIVQGGTDVSLRESCATDLVQLDFPGYALGGFSVGETPGAMLAALAPSAACLPTDKPRYLMGVGRPVDLLDGIAAGIDMFDCVMPTRNARNASAFTATGSLRLRNAKHQRDSGPIESGCDCYCCSNFSRAYLHHLFAADEMLGPTLLTIHNLAYYLRLMRGARVAIREGRFAAYRQAASGFADVAMPSAAQPE